MPVSVTQRIEQIEQPGKGFIDPDLFEERKLPSNVFLFEEENIMPSIVGMAVDYLVRFALTRNARGAFSISLLGAALAGRTEEAKTYLSKIKDIRKESIVAACRLVCFDQVLRSGAPYIPLEMEPDFKTIANIVEMVKRSLRFFKKYGPVVEDGFVFPGAYTDTVGAGDGDFLTKDTLWDFKTTKAGLTKKNTLQLIMYYLMGKRSSDENFESIEKIGVFNPRLNEIFILNASRIDASIMADIEENVIGYVGSSYRSR